VALTNAADKTRKLILTSTGFISVGGNSSHLVENGALRQFGNDRVGAEVQSAQQAVISHSPATLEPANTSSTALAVSLQEPSLKATWTFSEPFEAGGAATALFHAASGSFLELFHRCGGWYRFKANAGDEGSICWSNGSIGQQDLPSRTLQVLSSLREGAGAAVHAGFRAGEWTASMEGGLVALTNAADKTRKLILTSTGFISVGGNSSHLVENGALRQFGNDRVGAEVQSAQQLGPDVSNASGTATAAVTSVTAYDRPAVEEHVVVPHANHS